MLLYRCYVLLLSEDFAYIVTWLLHFFHADILQDAAPEQAEPISFLSFIHALHAWKRQMALWAAFYRSRCVKDKDKDMKDKPDRPGAPPEPEDEMGQIQKEILSRCPGNAVQETAKVKKNHEELLQKEENNRQGQEAANSSERFDQKTPAAGDQAKERATGCE